MTTKLDCACANLRRASRAVTQLYDEELRPAGLRATQFTLLQALERKGPVAQGELAELLAIDTTTLTRTLGALEARGWVRSRPGEDRRVREWSLTARGRKKYRAVLPVWRRAQERLRRRLGGKAFDSLLSSATRAARAARES